MDQIYLVCLRSRIFLNVKETIGYSLSTTTPKPTLSCINLVYWVHVSILSATWNSHLEEVGARLGAVVDSELETEEKNSSPCYFHGHPLDPLDWFIPHTRALLTWMKNSHIKLKLAAHLLMWFKMMTRIVHLRMWTKRFLTQPGLLSIF